MSVCASEFAVCSFTCRFGTTWFMVCWSSPSLSWVSINLLLCKMLWIFIFSLFFCFFLTFHACFDQKHLLLLQFGVFCKSWAEAGGKGEGEQPAQWMSLRLCIVFDYRASQRDYWSQNSGRVLTQSALINYYLDKWLNYECLSCGLCLFLRVVWPVCQYVGKHGRSQQLRVHSGLATNLFNLKIVINRESSSAVWLTVPAYN